MRWPWRSGDVDPHHVRASEQILDRLDKVAGQLDQLAADLRDTVEEERREAGLGPR